MLSYILVSTIGNPIYHEEENNYSNLANPKRKGLLIFQKNPKKKRSVSSGNV